MKMYDIAKFSIISSTLVPILFLFIFGIFYDYACMFFLTKVLFIVFFVTFCLISPIYKKLEMDMYPMERDMSLIMNCFKWSEIDVKRKILCISFIIGGVSGGGALSVALYYSFFLSKNRIL